MISHTVKMLRVWYHRLIKLDIYQEAVRRSFKIAQTSDTCSLRQDFAAHLRITS